MQSNTRFSEKNPLSIQEQEALLQSSPVFCMAPFTSLHINIEGKGFPCCNSAGYLEQNIGDLKKNDSLTDMWNSLPMKSLRQNMLQQQPSAICTACYTDEKFDKTSARQLFNREYSQHINRVNETEPDGTLLNNQVVFLDIRFSNLCNFSCRICSHYFSSQWFKEAGRLNLLSHEGNRISYAAPDMNAFMQELHTLLPHLEKIHFAGGEPLISMEHYQILEELIKLNRTDVRLSYNTNFSLLHYKQYNLADIWKQFKHIQISASLDGMGTRAELMRKGQNWAQVETNRQILQQECPHVFFVVNSAVSILNIWHLPDFYQSWVNRGYIGASDFDAYIVTEPEYLDVRRLPVDFKKQITEKYLRFFNSMAQTDAAFNHKALGQFNYLLQYLNSANMDMQPQFKNYMNKLDEFRGENSSLLFPELASLL